MNRSGQSKAGFLFPPARPADMGGHVAATFRVRDTVHGGPDIKPYRPSFLVLCTQFPSPLPTGSWGKACPLSLIPVPVLGSARGGGGGPSPTAPTSGQLVICLVLAHNNINKYVAEIQLHGNGIWLLSVLQRFYTEFWHGLALVINITPWKAQTQLQLTVGCSWAFLLKPWMWQALLSFLTQCKTCCPAPLLKLIRKRWQSRRYSSFLGLFVLFPSQVTSEKAGKEQASLIQTTVFCFSLRTWYTTHAL